MKKKPASMEEQLKSVMKPVGGSVPTKAPSVFSDKGLGKATGHSKEASKRD